MRWMIRNANVYQHEDEDDDDPVFQLANNDYLVAYKISKFKQQAIKSELEEINSNDLF